MICAFLSLEIESRKGFPAGAELGGTRKPLVKGATNIMSEINEDKRLVQHLKEVSLDCLKPFDTLLIQTDHSLYIFSAGDTAVRGTLCGGVFGRHSVPAMIAFPKEGLNARFNGSKITTGNQVVFLIKSGLKRLRVTTSVVTKLCRLPRQTNLAER